MKNCLIKPSFDKTRFRLTRLSVPLRLTPRYLAFKDVMPNIRNLAKSEKPLILNAIVLDSVLVDPNLRDAPSLSNPENAGSMLRDNLTVESGGNESQMVISYVDTDSQAAALVCNAVSESYLRHRDLFDRNRVQSLENWLAPEIARWEQEVEELQKRVEMAVKKGATLAAKKGARWFERG